MAQRNQRVDLKWTERSHDQLLVENQDLTLCSLTAWLWLAAVCLLVLQHVLVLEGGTSLWLKTGVFAAQFWC